MAEYVGKQLGNYRIVRLIGRGGFADVYLGEHIFLKTHVAVKILHNSMQPNILQTFLTEAQTIARLRNPHIVQILDFGVENGAGIPFLVMHYAPKGTLRDLHPEGSTVPLATVIAYVKQIATALQHAHNQKLIHQDIKPENMLLGDNNEVMLSDFGVVAVAHSTASLKTGASMGTISYMAPEQINGKPRPASDQYALSIVAYEWLSGNRPFNAPLPIQIAMQHLTETPPPLTGHISSEVEQVILRALSKKPEERYDSIEAFARALEDAANKKKLILIGTTLLTYTGHSGTIWSVAWSPDGSQIASASEDETVQVWDANTAQSVCTFTGHSANVRVVAWSPNGRYIASGSWDKTVQIWNTSAQLKLKYTGHSNYVQGITWSPDGTRIASGSLDRTVQIWDATTGKLFLIYKGHSQPIYRLAWSPNGKYISSSSRDNTVQVWNATTGQLICTYKGHPKEDVDGLAWSPDSSRIASASRDKTVQVWDAMTARHIFTYQGHSDMALSVAWSPNGKRVASGSRDGTVQIWEAATGQRIYTYRGHSDSVGSVTWSPNSARIASGSYDKTVQVWQAV